MKKIYTFFVVLFIVGSLMAQTPQSFKYQAVARDASGDVVADQAVGMQISILQGSTSGTAMYVETFTPTTNEFGLINLNIGAGTVVSGDFTTIDWSADTYFMKVEMDMTGGTTYEEYGTSPLLSVPYALHAKTAANTFSGNYSDLSGAPINVSTFTNDAGYLTSISETDPLFTAWDKSTGINITESQISDLDHFATTDETDPIFGTSIASGITGTDTTNWNNKLDSYTEADPIYTAWDKSTGISITESQITDFGNYESAFTKNTAFNKNFGNSAGTVTEGNDSRLSDARTPTIHATGHTDGSDDIQDATNSQKGLMTATYATKLEGIEAGAEVNVNADWNVSSGDAQILNKPSDLTDLSTHNVTELADISDAGSGSIISTTERTKLSGIETNADVTDVTNVDAAGAIMESDFNAATFLYATSDDIPQPKTVPETKGILNLGNVENTALSTWAGSGNIISLGTVTSGTLSTGAELADVTMSLGSDADGDIYYRSGGKLARLAKGSDDQVLTLESEVPKWKDATGGSTTYTVGDFAQGGIVFWVDETGSTRFSLC